MTLENPPIQEQTTNRSTGLFPQTWIRWFQDSSDKINELLASNSSVITSATTLNLGTRFILADVSSGSFTVTLPTARSAAGYLFTIKKTDASGNTVTVDGDGSDTIDGSTTQTLTGSSRPSMRVFSDGTEWWLV